MSKRSITKLIISVAISVLVGAKVYLILAGETDGKTPAYREAHRVELEDMSIIFSGYSMIISFGLSYGLIALVLYLYDRNQL